MSPDGTVKLIAGILLAVVIAMIVLRRVKKAKVKGGDEEF